VGPAVISLGGRTTNSSLRAALAESLFRVSTRGPAATGEVRLLGVEEPFVNESAPLTLLRSGHPDSASAVDAVELPTELDHLQDGDFVELTADGRRLTVVWRAAASINAMLLTERCDNYCLMCSQPPRDIDDSWLLERARHLIRRLPSDTPGFVLTGGEPTLYGSAFVGLLREIREAMPESQVHVLSNGRRFADPAFAEEYAGAAWPGLMVGIPVYGTEPRLHDRVVQAEGAFDETIAGILNLAALEQRLEIRVVVHRLTAPVLPRIAEFLTRNLPFVDQVALMGLEMAGLARRNAEELWIDPYDYRDELLEAVEVLDAAGMKVLVYNHQLCLVDPAVRPFTVRSISDWKNEYDGVCNVCQLREGCGGFFHSAKHRSSAHVRPLDLDGNRTARPVESATPVAWRRRTAG
jgi:His-Xaa-Ser system radical SAM maturase HxsC